MKTTVDISDALAREAKKAAAEDGLPLRALIEAGLRIELRERKKRGNFRLRDASFRGEGVKAPFEEGDWASIRAAIYEGRGG